MFYSSVRFVVVALKQLEADVTTSDEVREEATGVLWILEDRDPEINPQPEPSGLYYCDIIISKNT